MKPLVGKPGETVVHEAHEQNADVILCGSRGHGKLRRTFMGSVSDYIVHHSHVPVVVCRHKNHHHGHGHHHWILNDVISRQTVVFSWIYTNIRLCYFYCMTWTLCVSEFSLNVFFSGFSYTNNDCVWICCLHYIWWSNKYNLKLIWINFFFLLPCTYTTR